jgi:DNA-directed RNA polymerase subunit E'/Rpb7
MITRSITISIISIGQNLDETIRQKIQDDYEGKCVIEGYIKPGSSKIVSYSSGIVRGGNIIFEVLFECETCLPVEGMKINCIAINITKAGIRADIANTRPSPAIVFITRDHHYNVDYFNTIKEGDSFVAIVIGQRFELNDRFVSIIAKLEVSNDYKRSMKHQKNMSMNASQKQYDHNSKKSYIIEEDENKDNVETEHNVDYLKGISNIQLPQIRKKTDKKIVKKVDDIDINPPEKVKLTTANIEDDIIPEYDFEEEEEEEDDIEEPEEDAEDYGDEYVEITNKPKSKIARIEDSDEED